MDIVPEASPLTKMKTNDELEVEGLFGGFTEVNLDAILSQDNLINALEPTVSIVKILSISLKESTTFWIFLAQVHISSNFAPFFSIFRAPWKWNQNK